MSTNYVAPSFEGKSFNCPHCGATGAKRSVIVEKLTKKKIQQLGKNRSARLLIN